METWGYTSREIEDKFGHVNTCLQCDFREFFYNVPKRAMCTQKNDYTTRPVGTYSRPYTEWDTSAVKNIPEKFKKSIRKR